MEAEGGVAVAGVKVRYGAHQEGVGRRGWFRIDFSRVGPALPPAACEGTASAGEAAAEQDEEGQGGEGRDQDIEPSLCLQLGPTATQATGSMVVMLGQVRLGGN